MDTLFACLTLASLVLFIVGIFNPRASLCWASTGQTRLKSALVYALGTVVCFFIFTRLLVNANSPGASRHLFVSVGPPDYPQDDTAVIATLARELTALAHDSTRSPAARRAASQQAQERARHTFSATRLFDSYWADSARADREFRGRAFYVLGKVTDIHCYASGKAVVTLNNDRMMGGTNCFFEDAAAVATISTGQPVLVHAVGQRTTSRSAQLTHCVLGRAWPAQAPFSQPYE